jgi:hypothetical protein
VKYVCEVRSSVELIVRTRVRIVTQACRHIAGNASVYIAASTIALLLVEIPASPKRKLEG